MPSCSGRNILYALLALQLISTFERQIFDFLWSGKTSPLQRRTVYLPVDEGGLNLVHPLYKQKSLQLKILHEVVNEQQPHYFTQLPRYWFGRRLGSLHPSWDFLTGNDLPHFVGSTLPPFYKDLLEIFHTMDLTKLPPTPTPWQTHHFYGHFMQRHKHEPRAFQDFWSVHKVQCDTMWKHVFYSFSLGFHQCVHYRFLHRILPTQGFMWRRFQGKGYANLSTKCLACPAAIETNEHMFLDVWQPHLFGRISIHLSKHL